MNICKFAAPLLMTSILAGMVVLTNDSYGMERLLKQQAEQKKREAALQAQVHGGGQEATALKDPAHALDDAQPLGAAIQAARADAHAAAGNSLAPGGVPFVNNDWAGKLAALTALANNNSGTWGGAHAPGANDVAVHLPAVVAALGLGTLPDAQKKAAIDQFVTAAHQRLVRLADKTAKATGRKQEVAGRTLEAAALKDPAHALDNAQPLGVALLAARADALVAGGNSRAPAGAPFVNNDYAGKLAALTALANNNTWGGAHAPGANDVAVHLPAVVAALGLGTLPNPQKKTAIDEFVTAAHERLVRLQDKTAKAAARKVAVRDVTKYKDALADPIAAITAPVAPGNLLQAITNAVLVPGPAAANGMPHATNIEKIAVLRAIDGASAAGTDDVANSAIRTALGLDPAVLNFPATKPAVERFLNIARTAVIMNEIHTQLAAGTVNHIRQIVHAAGGNIPAQAFTGPNPDNREIMIVFSHALNLTIQEAVANGFNPVVGDVNTWLHQFGM